jgi:ABC-type multidrug transport system ATPase subunit
MEECEALCGRLTIMAMGKMQCIGSVQHLKSRFGSGYSMELRIGSETSSTLSVNDKIKMIQDALPLTLDEFREDYIRFTGDINLSLEEAFKFIEENKSVLNINDYSISQFPLEQIFNKFAHNENDSNAMK